jgi:hypothetical protein
MFLAARDSDGPAQVAAFEETLAVGRLLALQPPLISHLVGIAIDALALGELRFELTQHPPDAATLRALIQALERQTPLSPMVPHIECERNFCLDIIQMTYSDDGHGSGRYLPYQASKLGIIGGSGLAPKMPGSRLVNLRGIIMPRKAAAVALVNAHFDSVVSAAAAPIGKRAAADVDGMFIAHQTGYEVINAILPALGKYFQSCDQFEADLRGTRLMLAIELYKADKGEYPAALSDLTPVYAPEVLPDPISGMPFVYRRLQPGEDASGRLYLLYSCGPDKKDNGGKADPSSQHPNARAGFDWIINQPRPKPANPTEPPAPPPAKTDLPSPPP